MKLIILLSVLVLTSCGKVKIAGSDSFGVPKSLTPPRAITAGSSEYLNIKEICSAIKTKSLVMNSLVVSGQQYVFSGTVKSCTDSEYVSVSDATVTLTNQSGYKFTQGMNLFYFSEPETDSQGVMSLICQDVENLKSPINLNDDGVNFIYFSSANLADCGGGVDEKCLRVDQGVKVSDNQAKLHTSEWIKFKIKQPRLGFFTYRKLISDAGCEEGKLFGRTVTLK